MIVVYLGEFVNKQSTKQLKFHSPFDQRITLITDPCSNNIPVQFQLQIRNLIRFEKKSNEITGNLNFYLNLNQTLKTLKTFQNLQRVPVFFVVVENESNCNRTKLFCALVQ